ncbi:hypothetical protein PVAND_015424 [Polypedilum vanderplanki]|uniref:Uncharacterized protein n=1 Tax=Polypedilum vanderplanki TaxID=319348 RepID=A0A9J6BC75_POLVA|nr:hypothetical protein PVAND_015424 [Polypedilum vanderplanki]
MPVKPSKSQYKVVKILSVQQEGTSRIKIVKLVQKRDSIPISESRDIINLDDDDKENIIEVLDSDEEEKSSQNIKTSTKTLNYEISQHSQSNKVKNITKSVAITKKQNIGRKSEDLVKKIQEKSKVLRRRTNPEKKLSIQLEIVEKCSKKVKETSRKKMRNQSSLESPRLDDSIMPVFVTDFDEKENIENLPLISEKSINLENEAQKIEEEEKIESALLNLEKVESNEAQASNLKENDLLEPIRNENQDNELKVNPINKRKRKSTEKLQSKSAKIRKSVEKTSDAPKNNKNCETSKEIIEKSDEIPSNENKNNKTRISQQNDRKITKARRSNKLQILKAENSLRKSIETNEVQKSSDEPNSIQNSSIESNYLESSCSELKNLTKIDQNEGNSLKFERNTEDLSTVNGKNKEIKRKSQRKTKIEPNCSSNISEVQSLSNCDTKTEEIQNSKKAIENSPKKEFLRSNSENSTNLNEFSESLKTQNNFMNIFDLVPINSNFSTNEDENKTEKVQEKPKTRKSKRKSSLPLPASSRILRSSAKDETPAEISTNIYDEISAAVFSDFPQLPLTPPSSEASDDQPTKLHYSMRLKCTKTCIFTNIHQKKHKIDISSPAGIAITMRDVVDEKYFQNSLKKIEENSKAPIISKNETWHSGVPEKKGPKNEKKIPISDVLEAMREAGKERNFMNRGIRRFL